MSENTETELSEEELVEQLIREDLGIKDVEDSSPDITEEDVYEGVKFEESETPDQSSESEESIDTEESSEEEPTDTSETEEPPETDSSEDQADDQLEQDPRFLNIPAAEMKRIRASRREARDEAAKAAQENAELKAKLEEVESLMKLNNIDPEKGVDVEAAVKDLESELSPEVAKLIQSMEAKISKLENKGGDRQSGTQQATADFVSEETVQEALSEAPWLYNVHAENMAVLNDEKASASDKDAADNLIDKIGSIEQRVLRRPEYQGNDVETLVKRYKEVERLMRKEIVQPKTETKKPAAREKVIPDSLVSTGAASVTSPTESNTIEKAGELMNSGKWDQFFEYLEGLTPVERDNVNQEFGL